MDKSSKTWRRLGIYALIWLLLVSIVVLISWALGLVQNFRDLVIVAGLAAVGVATVMALFVPVFDSDFKKQPIQLPKPQIISETPGYQALHQLEPPPADFTGRENELEELSKAVKTGSKNIIAIQGMGGVGKTALALKLAELLTPRYPDAQILLNLRGTDQIPLSPADVLAYVVRSFLPQEKLPEGEALKALYRSLLHGKQVLLLMDNAHDTGRSKDLIPPAGSILLVTSRFHFALPGLKKFDLDKLPGEDAKELVLAIAPRLGDLAEELCRLCDYLPLALRVAASAVQIHADLSPQDYLVKLRDTVARLKLTGVDTSLRLSYDLLPENLKQDWTELSVFPAHSIGPRRPRFG